MRQFPVFAIRDWCLVSRRSTWTLGCAVLLALVALCLSGCGSSEGYTLVPVSGTITLDGQPLAGASVSFQRSGGEATVGPGSGAVTDASGKYELKTAEADSHPVRWSACTWCGLRASRISGMPTDDTHVRWPKTPCRRAIAIRG